MKMWFKTKGNKDLTKLKRLPNNESEQRKGHWISKLMLQPVEMKYLKEKCDRGDKYEFQ